MNDEDKATITKRDFAVAGVSLLVSGVGGAYFNKWLSRAKPKLQILSFGFDGTSTPFELPEELRKRTSADSWGKTLGQTATFEGLRSRYRSNLELIRKHEQLIPQVDKWLQQFKSRLTPASGTAALHLTAAEIDSHPYMQDELFGSSMIGNIRRLQVSEPPIIDLEKIDYRLTVLDRSDRAFVVQFGRKATRFPLDKMDSAQKRRLMMLMADSFAKGVLQNLVYYSEFFLNAAREDLLKLKALEEPLRDVLTKEARLTFQVALRNDGDTSISLRQYYATTLSAKQYSKTILLSILAKTGDQSNNGDLISKLAKQVIDEEDLDGGSPDSDDISKILPSARGSQLASIGAGEVKTIALQSLKPLGEDGKQIVALFQNDIIECEIFGFTSDGTRISSDRIPFGKSAIEREQQDILKRS